MDVDYGPLTGLIASWGEIRDSMSRRSLTVPRKAPTTRHLSLHLAARSRMRIRRNFRSSGISKS